MTVIKPDASTPVNNPAPSEATTALVAEPVPVAAPDETFPVAGGVSFVVGIGASAGGLEAFEGFFRACPVNTGMAFVLVPHLDPGHESLLTEILQRNTSMPVVQAQDWAPVEADHVYIIPPNREMALFNGALHLSMPELARGKRMPIDVFFRSMADDLGERAIGIVLSGTATDGTLGLRAILEAGGSSLVQDPLTAKYDGMPQSAIASDCATHVLLVEHMPAKLQALVGQASGKPHLPVVPVVPVVPAVPLPEKVLAGINKILLELRTSTGHDFSLYKKSTIGRRIARRMAMHHIEDEAVYVRFLKKNPDEIQLLFRELLINVTGFFRDSGAFASLKTTILPDLLGKRAPGAVFRVWVAGCSTGEEAYSIAMVLHELQAEMWASHEQELPIQIYATDLDDDAIAVARSGRYLGNIAQDIAPERLRRYFVKEPDGTYKIKKDIRDMVVFAVQNVIKDPPFTRLDLLSCRNLMIYLEPELQTRLINTFHYALKPNGVLFLSTSETITNQPELFSALDRKWKFYLAKHHSLASRSDTLRSLYLPVYQSPKTGGAMVTGTEKIAPLHTGNAIDIAEITQRALLQSHAPASVAIDEKGDILYIHGDTGRYLRPAPGVVSNNVVEMAREGLQPVLRSILLHGTTMLPVSQNVLVKTNGGFSQVRLMVQRLYEQACGAPLLLISFRDIIVHEQLAGLNMGRDSNSADGGQGIEPLTTAEAAGTSLTDLTRIQDLERKLIDANQLLQSTYEEQQAFNEELKSTNEELQSTNEELQSSNEELETSKEELQSLNEETVTVNAELNARIDQLTSIQNDMKNLLDSIGTGTLFLDHHRAIRRYTPAAVKIYRLISSDVGRPLSDIASNLDPKQHEVLQQDVQTVLDTLIPIEREVCSSDGAWYLARIQPYRTLDNVIEGVVLTFTVVTDLKLAYNSAQQAKAQLENVQHEATHLARELADGIINTVAEPLIVLDVALQVISVNQSFCRAFKISAAQASGQKIDDLGDGQWMAPALRELLENILPKNQVMEGYVLEHVFPELGLLRIVLNARRIITRAGSTELILLAMVSIQTVEVT